MWILQRIVYVAKGIWYTNASVIDFMMLLKTVCIIYKWDSGLLINLTTNIFLHSILVHSYIINFLKWTFLAYVENDMRHFFSAISLKFRFAEDTIIKREFEGIITNTWCERGNNFRRQISQFIRYEVDCCPCFYNTVKWNWTVHILIVINARCSLKTMLT